MPRKIIIKNCIKKPKWIQRDTCIPKTHSKPKLKKRIKIKKKYLLMTPRNILARKVQPSKEDWITCSNSSRTPFWRRKIQTFPAIESFSMNLIQIGCSKMFMMFSCDFGKNFFNRRFSNISKSSDYKVLSLIRPKKPRLQCTVSVSA